VVAVISFLEDSIVNLALWVVYALETVINLVLAGAGSLIAAAVAVLPAVPSAPSIDTGSWIGWLNWVFPIGDMLTAAASLLALYVTVLAVRGLLHWGGFID
jgi:hypothetical protein